MQVVFCTALICTYALQYTLLRYALWFKDFTCRTVAGVDFGNSLCVTLGDSSVATKFAIWFDMLSLFYVFRGFKRSLTSQTSLDITCNIPSHWKERPSFAMLHETTLFEALSGVSWFIESTCQSRRWMIMGIEWNESFIFQHSRANRQVWNSVPWDIMMDVSIDYGHYIICLQM